MSLSLIEHRAEREAERSDAIEAIERALSTIEGEHREPDQWERAFLVQAISWLFRGGYRLAALDADLALTPPNERSRASNIRPDPILDRCNTSLLRAAFHESTAEPLRDSTVFGPIIFTRS